MFDLLSALTTHQANLSHGRVSLAGEAGTLSVSIDDVLLNGSSDVLGNHQLVIDGEAAHSVDLADGDQWMLADQADIGTEHYLVFVDMSNQAKLLVNDKLNIIL